MTRNSKRFTFVAAALACALLAPATVSASDERLIERTVSAAGVRELAVKGHVGKIEVSNTTGDNVVLRLRLKPKEYDGWLFSRRKGDPERAELRSETRGDTLAFDLRYDGDRDGLEEHWDFQVPARLAARLNLSVGDINVRGLSGGLELKLNVGDITADIPEGSVTADVNVGDIRVVTSSRSLDRARLDANVGGTRIEGVDSGDVRRSRGYGPGDSIAYDGNGRDRIRLEVNVGDASLRLRPVS
jgi:hypothetical protein